MRREFEPPAAAQCQAADEGVFDTWQILYLVEDDCRIVEAVRRFL
jgi:hypothetical protein